MSLPVSMKLSVRISERSLARSQHALIPLPVRPVLQELRVCQRLGRFAAPVAVVNHVGSNVEVPNQHH